MSAAIVNPDLALLLVVAGILAIYLEFSSPGLFVPGAAGAAMTMVGVTSFVSMPLTGIGVTLLLLSLICYILEARFVTHGFFTLFGGALMILGALWLIDPEKSSPGIHPILAISLALPFACISSFLFSVAYAARRAKYDARKSLDML